MMRIKLGRFKIPFLLAYWTLKRIAFRVQNLYINLSRKRRKIYETNIQDLLKFRNDSPLNQLATPPFTMQVSGACLVLGKYVSSQIYHCARSNRWIEIYGFVLGRKLGDLFIGETFFEITNILQSSNSALPDLEHVFQLKRQAASQFPGMEIVCTIHSHPNGILRPSGADKICFLGDDHPNVIVSPRRLLWGSPIRRLSAFFHSAGKVRRIKLYEIDKKEIELKDIDIKELEPSKEELLKVGELATEINFGIFKIWLVSHPNLSLEKLGKKLSEIFSEKIGFIFLHEDEGEWAYDPKMKVVDFFLRDGSHLVFPEFFKEVDK